MHNGVILQNLFLALKPSKQVIILKQVTFTPKYIHKNITASDWITKYCNHAKTHILMVTIYFSFKAISCNDILDYIQYTTYHGLLFFTV